MGRNEPKLIHRWEAAWGTQALQLDLTQRLVQCKIPVPTKTQYTIMVSQSCVQLNPIAGEILSPPWTFFSFSSFFFSLNMWYNVSLCRNTLSFNMSVFFYPLSLPHRLSLDNHTHCGQCQKKPTLCLCPVPYSLLTPCQDIDGVQDLSLQPCHGLVFYRIPF